MQAKPAILGSIDQADDAIVEILRKSAKLAVRALGRGKSKRLRMPRDLMELLIELAPEEAAKFAGAPGEEISRPEMERLEREGRQGAK